MTAPARTPRVLTALGSLMVIVAGAGLWHQLPAATDIYAPFDVHGDIGQHTAGRGLAATVDAAVITPRLNNASGKQFAATGTWIVVEGTFDAGSTYALAHAELLVGPNRYAPTDRLLYMPAALQPGIADRRGWAFGVAPDVLESVTSLVFRMWVGDGRLDSRLVIDIPLDDSRVRRTDDFELPPPTQDVR